MLNNEQYIQKLRLFNYILPDKLKENYLMILET